MRTKLSCVGVLSVGALVAVACGDDGQVHMIPTIDAAAPDAPEPCKAADMYTAALGSGSGDQNAEDHPKTGSGTPDETVHQIYYDAALNMEDPGDYLFIDFYAEYGGFGSGDIVPGTYTLTGDDTAYSTCGICVMIAGDYTDAAGVDDWYMASGGILTLTSTTTNLTGTLSNVTFKRVITDPDGSPSDALQGDCSSRIASAMINAPIVAGSAARTINTDMPVRVLRHRKQ